MRSLTWARPARGALFSFCPPMFRFQFRRLAPTPNSISPSPNYVNTLFLHEKSEEFAFFVSRNLRHHILLPFVASGRELASHPGKSAQEKAPKKIGLAEKQSRFEANLAQAISGWHESHGIIPGHRIRFASAMRLPFAASKRLGRLLFERFSYHDVHSARSCFAVACSTT